MQSALDQDALVAHLQHRLPNVLAVYAFGSRFQGTASADSDLDLAVLLAGYVPPLELWALSGELADIAGCTVDLLDFRAASTVMQYQILTTGECWWAADAQAALYEAAVLSEKVELDAARAGLIADIEQRGQVYGR